MPGYVRIITPENVGIDYELAGLASRAGAVVIDSLIQGLLMVTAALVVWLPLALTKSDLRMLSWTGAILIILEFVIYWGYYIRFETVWNGQTPGKRVMRLRVIRDGGLPIDFGCAAIRNLIRPVDSSIIGLISILVSRRNQRLGDFAAGTLVVKERAEWTGDLEQTQISVPEAGSYSNLVKNIELVTPEEFEAAKRFVLRKAELREEVREQLAARVAGPIMKRLGIEDKPGIVYSEILSELYRRCLEERGMR